MLGLASSLYVLRFCGPLEDASGGLRLSGNGMRFARVLPMPIAPLLSIWPQSLKCSLIRLNRQTVGRSCRC